MTMAELHHEARTFWLLMEQEHWQQPRYYPIGRKLFHRVMRRAHKCYGQTVPKYSDVAL